METNTVPLTMSFEEFGQRAAILAQEAEAQPIGHRADALDRIAALWQEQGFTVLAQTWRDAAAYARRTYGG